MKVLVIGDNCIDKFIYCNIERVCPEAPVPVMNPVTQTDNPGMAGNVIVNLKALNVTTNIITNKEIISKTRYVDNRSGQMVVRIDENDKCSRITQDQLKTLNWGTYDAIIVSDYCKGFLNENDIEYISKNHPLTFLDTKKQLGDWCNNISFIKINEFEHKKNFELLPNYPMLLDKLIVTKGKKGCEHKNITYKVPLVSVKDVSGAGDTFLCGLVKKYVETKNIKESLIFANNCATAVVQKSGVATL
tara:strand:- start:1046 stop:1783 length:738 start_codon:yes stop_codon:yes gene_type:complete